MIIRHFLNLIRWRNLLLLLLIQLLLKFVLFPKYDITYVLDTFHFFLLTIAISCITAGGYIINDYYDVATDAINKPEKVTIHSIFTKKSMQILYLLLNIIGVSLGAYISFYIEIPLLSILFLLVFITLYFYSKTFKKIAVLGNFTVAFLISLSILLIPLFDVVPNLNENELIDQILLIKTVILFAAFAFVINLIREIIKDIEDINGDFSLGMSTLPILIGRTRTITIVFNLSLLFMIALIYTLITYQHLNQLLLPYGIITIIIPLLFFIIKLKKANHKSDFSKLSTLLKLIMLTGIATIILI